MRSLDELCINKDHFYTRNTVTKIMKFLERQLSKKYSYLEVSHWGTKSTSDRNDKFLYLVYIVNEIKKKPTFYGVHW